MPTSGDEDRAREIGAQAYVAKPISVVRFVQTVDDLLEVGRVGRRRYEKGGPGYRSRLRHDQTEPNRLT